MNKNQNKRAKNNAKQPLSKKQRKKLAKSGVAIKTRAPREKLSREKKWIISLIAAVCVMALACASFGSILLARVIGDALRDPTESIYDTVKLHKHLDTNAVNTKFYTNNIIDLAEIEADYRPLTLADMDAHIRDLQVSNRTLKKELQRQTPFGLGDTVYLYVTDIFSGEPLTSADEEKNRIAVPAGSNLEYLFGTYTMSTSLVLGMGTFGEDFDNELLKLGELGFKPTDTVREIREVGDISLSDTVCITYGFQKGSASSTPYAEKVEDRYTWATKMETAYTKFQERVELKDLDERFAQALVDNCPTVGESFTFVLEDYNLTGKASDAENDYRVTVQVMYVVTEEVTKDITFTFPKEYFAEADGDFYALNGKTATMRVTVLYADDYEVPEFNRTFITETLKMDITATSDDAAVQEYKEKQLVILNEERAENKKNAQISAAISHMVKKAGSYYFDSDSDVTEMETAILQHISRLLLEGFLSTYGFSPTTVQLDEYAIYLAALKGVTISGAQEYIYTVASSDAATMKKTDLMVYQIFREEDMKITDDALNKAYTEYLDNLVGSMRDPETHNKDYFVELYGENVIKSWVRRDLVYSMVGEYLLAKNSLALK